MASDYGDDAGSKMIDDFMRFGERMGERAMYARAAQMQRAFQNATRTAREAAGEEARPEEAPPEWAKLDMHEFQGIEGYDEIKGVIEDRLAAHGVGSTWFPAPETGKEYLLFRIADAREVWQSFDELSRETDDAAAKAAEKIREQHIGTSSTMGTKSTSGRAMVSTAALPPSPIDCRNVMAMIMMP